MYVEAKSSTWHIHLIIISPQFKNFHIADNILMGISRLQKYIFSKIISAETYMSVN